MRGFNPSSLLSMSKGGWAWVIAACIIVLAFFAYLYRRNQF